MKRKIFQDLLRKHGLGKLKGELAKYLTEQRKSKIEKVLKVRISSIEIAFESPIDIHNALASFRTIEAFGLIGVHVINAIFKRCKGKKTTQGAHHWVNLNYHNSLQDFLDKNDCFLVGASCEATNTLEEIPIDSPICLLFGNENSGLSSHAQKACDFLYKIPLFGMSQSLNLSASAAISCYDLARRKRKELALKGDLTFEEIEKEKAWYYFLSLGAEQSKKILERMSFS